VVVVLLLLGTTAAARAGARAPKWSRSVTAARSAAGLGALGNGKAATLAMAMAFIWSTTSSNARVRTFGKGKKVGMAKVVWQQEV
jgi:hypothetical protein